MSEEKDSTQFPLQRQALPRIALQSQKSKANMQKINPTIFRRITDTNLLEGFHKGLQNCFRAYIDANVPNSDLEQPCLTSSVPHLTASEQKPPSQIGQVLKSDQRGVPTLSWRKKSSSKVPLQGVAIGLHTFLPAVPHLGTHLGVPQSKEEGTEPRSSLSLGDALPLACGAAAAVEDSSQQQSHRGHYSKSNLEI